MKKKLIFLAVYKRFTQLRTLFIIVNMASISKNAPSTSKPQTLKPAPGSARFWVNYVKPSAKRVKQPAKLNRQLVSIAKGKSAKKPINTLQLPLKQLSPAVANPSATLGPRGRLVWIPPTFPHSGRPAWVPPSTMKTKAKSMPPSNLAAASVPASVPPTQSTSVSKCQWCATGLCIVCV